MSFSINDQLLQAYNCKLVRSDQPGNQNAKAVELNEICLPRNSVEGMVAFRVYDYSSFHMSNTLIHMACAVDF